jgi:hypothetical protein
MALRTIPTAITHGLLLGAAPRTNPDGTPKTDRDGALQYSAEVLLVAPAGYEQARVTITDASVVQLAAQHAGQPLPVTIEGLEVGAYASGAGASFYWSARAIRHTPAARKEG